MKENKILNIETLKRTILKSLFADDDLMSELVVKGGTAIHLLQEFYSRSSMDIDISIKDKFLDIKAQKDKIENAINMGLKELNLKIIDYKFEETPENMSVDLASFWGGYIIKFKIIDIDSYNNLSGQKPKQEISKKSVSLDEKSSKVFSIDISNFEFTDSKEIVNIDGYSVFIYTAEAIVFEKIRAICQQQAEYREIIKSSHNSSRAKDFYDIYFLSNKFSIDFKNQDNFLLLENIFEAKQVPLYLMSKIQDNKKFYEIGFTSVRQTVKGEIKEFDFYFDFVVEKCKILESFWKV